MYSGSTDRTQQKSETIRLPSSRLLRRVFRGRGPGLVEPVRSSYSTAVGTVPTPLPRFSNPSFLLDTLRPRPFAFTGLPSPTSKNPSRSTNVSTLVRSLISTTLFSRPAPLDPPSTPDLAAWSLCCQQKNAVASPFARCSPSADTKSNTQLIPAGDARGDGEERGEAARARRHGRPADVMPLQVVAGFLESERARRDSGVWGMKGIV